MDGQTFNEGRFPLDRRHRGEVYAGEIKTAPSEIIQVLIDKTLRRRKKAAPTRISLN